MSVAKPRLALPVLSAGHNCWRVEPVRRLAFLVDGQDCFRAMRSAFVQAQHSTDVLAWDIDSRMRLCPDGARATTCRRSWGRSSMR